MSPPSTDAAVKPGSASRSRPLVASGAAVSLIIAVLVVIAIVLTVLVANQPDTKLASRKTTFSTFERDGMAAARQIVLTLLTLSPQTASTQVKNLLGSATGAFRSELAQIATTLEKTVDQAKVTTTGRIVQSGVRDSSQRKHTVVVQVAAQQDVTNSAGAKADPRSYRLTVTMQQTQGKFRVADVAFVP